MKNDLKDYWDVLHHTDDAIMSLFATVELPEDVFNPSLPLRKGIPRILR